MSNINYLKLFCSLVLKKIRPRILSYFSFNTSTVKISYRNFYFETSQEKEQDQYLEKNHPTLLRNEDKQDLKTPSTELDGYYVNPAGDCHLSLKGHMSGFVTGRMYVSRLCSLRGFFLVGQSTI